ncbi:MAG: hypothetical protein OXU25_01700 [Thaumarchaeota archaeon]|nr:hypothetical protein [Nitrososphaerota archaeon]
MDYYGPRDHGALPSMLAHLYERRDSLLRPGLSLALQPNGRICGIVSRSGREARDFYEMLMDGHAADMSATVTPGTAPALAPVTLAHGSAHLPFGFRSAQSMSPGHAIAPAPWPGSPASHGPAAGGFGRIPEMRPARFSAPRRGFDQYGLSTFLEGTVLPVLSHELDMCARELSRFCLHTGKYVRAGAQTLDGLCRFVRGIGGDYSPSMRLDTVFVGIDVFEELTTVDPHGARVEGTQGAVEHGGLRVIGHAHLPDSTMYVMSHTHGPIFVNGPTTITCAEDEFVVGRYCQLVAPQGGLSGKTPYGLKLDVVGE